MTNAPGRTLLYAAAMTVLAATGAGAAPITLPGSIAPGSIATLTPEVTVVGEADPAAPVSLQVALRLRAFGEMTARTAAGDQITPAELSARYLPTQASYDAVIAWLRAMGLTVTANRPDRLSIGVSGSAQQVAAAFATHFAQITVNGAAMVSADAAPSVPASLAAVIMAINGLQPQLHAEKQNLAMPLVNNGFPPYGPKDFISAYKATGLGNGGLGTTTAIVIDTFPNKADLTSFWSLTGVSQKLSNISFVQAVPGTLPDPSGEESLDVETSSSIAAPNGKVRVYASQNLNYTSLDTAFGKVISDLEAGVKITQVSISLGACESSVGVSQAETDDQMFAVMQAMGATVFASSGDSGSMECGGTANVPSFFSTSPNLTAVGGTTLNMTARDTYLGEAGWTLSGGGLSKYFTRPAYQSKVSRLSQRAVPDISADASPYTGELLVVGGQSLIIGGTSLSSPLVAGLTALVNAARIKAGEKTLGALNPRLYRLKSTAGLRDILTGNNGGYQVTQGYDLVTGLGTPKMSALLPELVAQP